MQKSVIFVKKDLRKDIWKIKKYREVRDHCHYRGAYRDNAHSICNLKHCLPKKIPIIFYSRSNYDYHFVIKELAEEFENQSICLGENTKKCIKNYKKYILHDTIYWQCKMYGKFFIKSC